MSGKRVLALYGALLLGFAAVVCRLYWLCSNTGYAARASAQSEAVLRLPAARGNFYDCDGLPLTGLSEQWLALCFPGAGSYARLYPYADADGQAVLYRERNASRPFLLEVAQDVRRLGVRCYAVPRRYAAAPLAEHLIGYLDGEGRGAAGLEAALDDILSTGGQDILRCAVTAQGRLRRGSEPVLEKASSAAQGVRLTLSRSIQRAAEGVAAESMAAGCIPIVGYNMGAEKRLRVRQLFTRLLIAEAAVGAVALLLAECFPRSLIAIFGAANESSYYTDFALRAFRIYLSMVVLACVNKACFIFLQAVGKALASTLLSMIREVVFGVGFALLLPVYFGLDGVLYSMPVSDVLTFLIAAVLILRTYRWLGQDVLSQLE